MLRLSGFNHRYLFLTVLEAEVRDQDPAGLDSGEVSLQLAEENFSLCPHSAFSLCRYIIRERGLLYLSLFINFFLFVVLTITIPKA